MCTQCMNPAAVRRLDREPSEFVHSGPEHAHARRLLSPGGLILSRMQTTAMTDAKDTKVMLFNYKVSKIDFKIPVHTRCLSILDRSFRCAQVPSDLEIAQSVQCRPILEVSQPPATAWTRL
mgnify:CR=1 FL=1